MPIVFGEEDLTRALLDAGVDPARPVFVNWLGCTYYLSETAVSQTLCALAAVAAAGSRVVLDYWTETAVPDVASRCSCGARRSPSRLVESPSLA